jgi:hypothetical protein
MSILFVLCGAETSKSGSGKNIGSDTGECCAEEGGWAVTGYWKALRGEGLRY